MEIQTNDITLYYEKIGKKAPLILLHGNGEDHHIFDELICKLKDEFTVYAIDSRNHGQSSKTDALTYDLMMQDIVLFLEKLDMQSVNFLGFSDGAIITLLIAMQYPKLVKKMILLGINLKPSDFKKHALAQLHFQYTKTNDPLIKLMLTHPNIALSDIKKIQTPTLVVAGQNDIFYRKTFSDLQKALPHASLQIMPKHNHTSYIVHQDILSKDIITFLK